MATRRADDIARALLTKGMERDEAHHHMYRKSIDGVTHLVTRISHGGSKDINDSLGKLMANQCCLQLREFWQLVDCAMTEAAWDEVVRERCAASGRNPFLGR